MDEKADSSDHEDHDHRELVHLKVETGAEITGDDPVEEFFAEGLAGLLEVNEEFADGFECANQRNAGGGKRYAVDEFVRPLCAEKTVDSRAEQRQQRNDPKMFEYQHE